MRIADSGLSAALGAVIGLSLAAQFQRDFVTLSDWLNSGTLAFLSLAILILISRTDSAFAAAKNGDRALPLLSIGGSAIGIMIIFFGYGFGVFEGELRPNPPHLLTALTLIAWSVYYVIYVTES